MLVAVYTEYKVLATFTTTDITYICNQATELREHQEHHSLSRNYLYFLLTAVSMPQVLSYWQQSIHLILTYFWVAVEEKVRYILSIDSKSVLEHIFLDFPFSNRNMNHKLDGSC